ncbi:LuxR C-terminal-related transcriptional regulator [Rhizobacter sp. J219]|jgi:DNA-binding NarL/FixJ family response regulator|uniref:response regulator transcription factor n=1 Tax=Rhizobacter sp. J219 TaxID=2898430 RepID=UPI002151469B|nr:LuxR C-terminal-related transcriptional regulator [Rhizobacter sp. J219]MCR5885850.1 LuxR C-terminal-related transcriptional regulator [Rhizobacter sp. J219]
MTNQHQKTDAHSGEGTADTRVLVGSRVCRIVCVDDIVPKHVVESRRHARPRLVYAEGELAHFEVGEHRYALVLDETPEEKNSMPRENLHDLLTNREMQIVQFICLGYLTKQIADRLHLSEFTVRSYLKTIYCKLGVRSRAAMVFRYTQAFGSAKSG